MRLLTQWLILFVTIVLLSVHLPLRTAYTQDSLAWEILGLLNSARTANGVAPLALNSRLVAASQRHSDDMAEGDFLSHTGSDGSAFWTRMTDAGYATSAGAENVQYRWDASATGVFQHWSDSAAHYANMMSPAYQEVGIAHAISASGKHYFTMVLGAGPGFVPSIASNPTSVYPLTGTPIGLPETTAAPVTIVRETPAATVFTAGTELPTPVAALTVLPIGQPPEDAAVAVDNLRATETGVLGTPAYTILDTSSDPVQPRRSIREMFFDLPPETILEGNLQTPTRSQETVNTPGFQSPSPTPAPMIIPTTELIVADLRLEYSDQSFTIINMAGSPVYIEGLRFESRSGALNIDRWDTEYLSAPLDSFPDKGCLQAWGYEADGVLSPPNGCQIRHGWVVVNDDQRFWQNAEIFTVHRYDETVTVCIVGLGSCDVNLSDRLTVYPTLPPASVSVEQVPTSAGVIAQQTSDVRLVYTEDSFTILNTSGTTIDLVGLGFSSRNGTLSINQWDTEFLSRPLYAFPSGDCLQAWPLHLSEWPSKTGDCNLRHAWIAVNDTNTFWIDADYFTVSRSGNVITTCRVDDGRCEFNFP